MSKLPDQDEPKRCSVNVISGSVSVTSIGWEIMLVTILTIIILGIIQSVGLLQIGDLYFVATICFVIGGGIIAIVGNAISKNCLTRNALYHFYKKMSDSDKE